MGLTIFYHNDDSASDRMDEALEGRGGFGINLN